MIYTLKIKKSDNTYIDVNIDYVDFNINDEVPCMIEYRKQCSSTWTQQKQNEWWDFVDTVLQQESISLSDFVLVWNVICNGVIYGNENNKY